MNRNLSGCHIAVLATDGVGQVELTEPVKALKEAGVAVEVASPRTGKLQGFNHLQPAEPIGVDCTLSTTGR